MRRVHPVSLLAVMAIVAIGTVAATRSSPAKADREHWKLTFRDEFDGTEIDRSKWDFDLGNGFYDYVSKSWVTGWGNNERQYYTGDKSNARVQDGLLTIQAIKESRDGCGYTSARMKTTGRDGRPLFSQKYGRFEFRAKLPAGQGIWPALWLLPQNSKFGTWAASGEIDIVEAKGHEPDLIYGTLHYGGRWPQNVSSGKSYPIPDAGKSSDFHVYALEWEPGKISWFIDDVHCQTQSFWYSSSKLDGTNGAAATSESDLNNWPAPFDQPFYIVMNLAVGGEFPGDPDDSTPFPAAMSIDYVRVYTRADGYGPAQPRGDGTLPFKSIK